MKTDRPIETNHSESHLEPIESPGSLKLKFAYWYTRWQFGKVITPLKVIYARFSEALGLSSEIQSVEQKSSLPARLKHLIEVYVATLNGCSFCVDMGRAGAQQEGLDPELFEDLLQFEESDAFTEEEKATRASTPTFAPIDPGCGTQHFCSRPERGLTNKRAAPTRQQSCPRVAIPIHQSHVSTLQYESG